MLRTFFHKYFLSFVFWLAALIFIKQPNYYRLVLILRKIVLSYIAKGEKYKDPVKVR